MSHADGGRVVGRSLADAGLTAVIGPRQAWHVNHANNNFDHTVADQPCCTVLAPWSCQNGNV